jgi:hypothetical protein
LESLKTILPLRIGPILAGSIYPIVLDSAFPESIETRVQRP